MGSSITWAHVCVHLTVTVGKRVLVRSGWYAHSVVTCAPHKLSPLLVWGAGFQVTLALGMPFPGPWMSPFCRSTMLWP